MFARIRSTVNAATRLGGVPERIDDPDDPRLADYRQLKDAVARRQIEGDELFVAEGPVAIERMIASGHRVRSVLVDERKYDRMAEAAGGRRRPGVRRRATTCCTRSPGSTSTAARSPPATRRPATALADLLASARRLAVLEGLNDPENLGAVARSARAFGVEALVLDPTCIDPYTRRTVRVSMGEILHAALVPDRGRTSGRATRFEARTPPGSRRGR